MENFHRFVALSWLFLSFLGSLTTVVGRRALDLDNNAEQGLDEATEYGRMRRNVGSNIEVSGRITFKDRSPETIPPNSQLRVEFIDIKLADASHIELASTLVDLSNYKNPTPLFYNITSKKPADLHDMHSIVAVLNMGWIPKGGKNDDWLRHADYHTTHNFMVNMTSRGEKFVRDIELEIFTSPTSSAVKWGKDATFKAVLLLLVPLFFLK